MWESDQCKEQNNIGVKSAVLPSLQSNFLKEVEFHPFKCQPVQKVSETMFKSQCDLKKKSQHIHFSSSYCYNNNIPLYSEPYN